MSLEGTYASCKLLVNRSELCALILITRGHIAVDVEGKCGAGERYLADVDTRVKLGDPARVIQIGCTCNKLRKSYRVYLTGGKISGLKGLCPDFGVGGGHLDLKVDLFDIGIW